MKKLCVLFLYLYVLSTQAFGQRWLEVEMRVSEKVTEKSVEMPLYGDRKPRSKELERRYHKSPGVLVGDISSFYKEFLKYALSYSENPYIQKTLEQDYHRTLNPEKTSELKIPVHFLKKLKVDMAFNIRILPLLSQAQFELQKNYKKSSYRAIYFGYHVKKETAKLYSPSQRSHGIGDAFRHALWSALMTKYISEDFAILFSTAQEMFVDDKKDDHYQLHEKFPSALMDLLNDAVGIQIGLKFKDRSDQEIVNIIRSEIDSGSFYILEKGEIIPSSFSLGN